MKHHQETTTMMATMGLPPQMVKLLPPLMMVPVPVELYLLDGR